MNSLDSSNTIRPPEVRVEYVSTTSLLPHPDNPRVHPKSQLRKLVKSIRTFGFRVPVLIDEHSQLICGHARVEASKIAGIERIPALRVTDLSERQVRAFMVADNRLSEISAWDDVLLGENLKIICDLDLNLDFDPECLGFDYGEVETRIRDAEDESTPDADILPSEALGQPISRPSDVWLLGTPKSGHRVLCADATSSDSYERLMGSDRAAMVFSDPPYNVSARHIGRVCAQEHGAFEMAAGEMTREEFTAFLAHFIEHLCRFSQEGSIHYLCMDWRHSRELLDAGLGQYAEFKNLCVWVKDMAGMGSFYRSQHELVFVFKNGNAPHRNHFSLGQFGRARSNVWKYPSARSGRVEDGDPAGREALRLHPTIKPVRLIEDALLDCSRRREIVLDPFLGSGSTLIACEKAKRRCYGMELTARYVDVAIHRWETWTGREAVHEKTCETFAAVGKRRNAEGE